MSSSGGRSKGSSSSGSRSSSSGGGLLRASNETEFVCQLSFKNNLPAVPSGPFFKKLALAHSFEEFAQYKTSSLEKSYIWQPHFGPDASTKLCLVDQDAVLVNKTDEKPSKEILRETKEYTSATSSSGVDTRKKETKQKHWWLRETVYSENNILKNRSAAGDEGSLKVEGPDNAVDPFSVAAINETFETVKRKIESLSDKIEWSIPILPDLLFGEKDYSYISFDEDPHLAVGPEGEDASKKRKRKSIITNIRESKSKKGSGDNTYAASLVGPSSSSESSESSSSAAAGGRDDADAAEQCKFEWIKDFRMIMKSKEWQDHYIFLVDVEEMRAKYFAVGVNMIMDKLQIDEVDPHDVTVTRRTKEEEEQDRLLEEEGAQDDGDDVEVEVEVDADDTAAAAPAIDGAVNDTGDDDDDDER